jgi:hypothetical protein
MPQEGRGKELQSASRGEAGAIAAYVDGAAPNIRPMAEEDGSRGGFRGARGGDAAARHTERYFEADSDAPSAACPAASRAVSTRNGEQDT